jgi:probable phosphoglycerate mutase
MSAAKGNILIVGHAGINRLLLCHMLGMPIENLFRFSQDYACINIIVYERGQYCVKLLNGQRIKF